MYKVSIIIPNYNRAQFIAETLESVLNQTAPNWECIIVDDGSTDNSIDIIKEFTRKDKRFKLYKRDRQPKGAPVCRNIGVEKSSGEYLIFLDTDDILAPYCVEQRLKAIKPDVDFALFPSLLFKNKPYDLNLWWNIDKKTPEIIRHFRHDAIVQGTGALWKKKSFVKLDMWNENLLIWQDIELFLKAYIEDYKYEKFFNLPSDLHVRFYDQSISRGGYYQLQKIKSRETVIKNVYNLLIENDKKRFIKFLIFLAYDVLNSYYISKNFRQGDFFNKWLYQTKIFTKKDLLCTKVIKYIYKYRLSKFTKPIIKQINKLYAIQSTIGKIKYKNE